MLRTLPRRTSRWRYWPSAAHAAGRSRASTKDRARSCASQVSVAAKATTVAKTEQRTRKSPSRHKGSSEPIRARGLRSNGARWPRWALGPESAGQSLESETLRRSSGGGSKRERVRKGLAPWWPPRRRRRGARRCRRRKKGGGGARKGAALGQRDIAAGRAALAA
jgi:hypothetical protein